MSEKEENSDDKMEIDSNGSTENGIAETIDPKDIKKEPMEDDEESGEDDPIVKEIPVFLSKGLSKNLFLFQYPVRPCTLPYDPTTTSVMDARIKPNQQKVELTLGLNTSCSNFDRSKSEQIALNVDGSNPNKNSDKEIYYGRGVMDRITLSSNRAVKEASRYAAGIFNGSELHLTPLKGIVSLKPSLEYLDKSDKTAKAEGRPRLNESSQDEDEDDEGPKKSEVEKVGVKFARGGGSDGGRAQELKKKTFEYQQQRAAEEAWVPLDYHHVKTDVWVEETQKLFCKHLDDVAIQGTAQPDIYLEKLRDALPVNKE